MLNYRIIIKWTTIKDDATLPIRKGTIFQTDSCWSQLGVPISIISITVEYISAGTEGDAEAHICAGRKVTDRTSTRVMWIHEYKSTYGTTKKHIRSERFCELAQKVTTILFYFFFERTEGYYLLISKGSNW